MEDSHFIDRTIELPIFGLSSSGSGVGKATIDEKEITVFVHGAAPGDVVRAHIVSFKGTMAQASLIEIVTPGADRVVPPCPYVGTCGGCSVQHVAYARQLKEKMELVSRALSPVVPDIQKVLRKIIPSRAPLGTRTRGRFHVAVDEDDGEDQPLVSKRFGLHCRESDEIADIESCIAVDPKVNEAFQWVRTYWLDEFPHGTQIEFVLDELKGKVIAVAFPPVANENPDGPATMLDVELPDETPPAWLSLHVGESAEGAYFYPIKGDRPLRFVPEVFSQSDAVQNRVLVQEVLKAAAVNKEDRVLDLCCGVGNFSLPLAKKARKVEGVEGSRRAVELAQNNAIKWGATNVYFDKGDVQRIMYEFARKGKRFEVVLLDPPRVGVGSSIGGITDITIKRIVYVSCSPKSLAKDLALIKGFKVVSVQPIDMFPQTMHVETIVVLERDHAKDQPVKPTVPAGPDFLVEDL